MVKKQNKSDGAAPPARAKKHKVPDISVRFVDPRLGDALDRCAAVDKRSVNNLVNVLLEEALKARGFWPPPDAPAPCQS